MTQLITLDPQQPEPAAIALAATILRAGKLVAFPTETVYGLGANALDPLAVERIYKAKGRPASDPLIVHIADLDQLDMITIDLPAIVPLLARYFWPGPLTLVLRRSALIPASVSAGLDTVAVRIPRHPVAHALIEAAGLPIAAPSANRFARPSPTTAQHVYDDLAGRVDMILDGGPTTIGLESTVVDLSGDPPAVLRPGGLSVEALRRFIPNIHFTPRYTTPEKASPSPGTLLKHYSPDAELILVSGMRTAVLEYIRAEIVRRHTAGQRIGILAVDEDRAFFDGLPAQLLALGSEGNLAQVGTHLFARIRELDQAGVDCMFVRSLEQTGIGLAIWDRLVRAAEGRVVEV